MSKERPFTPRAQELEAILAGRQTQFRRPMKPQPRASSAMHRHHTFLRWKDCIHVKWPEGQSHLLRHAPWISEDALWLKEKWLIDCPYGPPEGCDNPDHVYHFQGEPAPHHFPMPWRAAATMPRWASRLTLHVLNVGVERVQGIDEIGAQKEGWFYQGHNLHHAYDPVTMDTARRWFIEQWDAAYAAQGFGFDASPWIWKVDFELVPLGYKGNEG